MKIIFIKVTIAIPIFMSLLCFVKNVYSAVDQILNNNFFLNPAELSLTKKAQVLIGNVFISPKLKFAGTTPLGYGKVVSRTHNGLPYALTAYRFTDRFVGIEYALCIYG